MKKMPSYLAFLWILPFFVVFFSYLIICFQTHTVWPWLRVVHEDMQSTLLQTVFHFEHATGELSLDLILGFAVAGSVQYFYPLCPLQPGAGCLKTRRVFLALALITLGMILGGALLTVGWAGVVDNLAQLKTRPGEPLEPGAHWRYHFLSRLALMCLAFFFVGSAWLLAGRHSSDSRQQGRNVLVLTALLYALLSLLFGFSWEPFNRPIFLGHQARELLTHTLVTLPLALATTLMLAHRFATTTGSSKPPMWPIPASGIAALALALYLVVGALLTRAVSLRQTTGIAAAIFPHFFEHALSYLIVSLVAGWAYLEPASVSKNASQHFARFRQ